MTNARGVCPTCLKERRLTPQRQVLATHTFDGVKCEGSGSKPSKITRLASEPQGSSAAIPASIDTRIGTESGKCQECGQESGRWIALTSSSRRTLTPRGVHVPAA